MLCNPEHGCNRRGRISRPLLCCSTDVRLMSPSDHVYMPAHEYGRSHLSEQVHQGLRPEPTPASDSLWREKCCALLGPLLLLAGGVVACLYYDALPLEEDDLAQLASGQRGAEAAVLGASALLIVLCVLCQTCRAWHKLVCAPCLKDMSVLYSQM